jgi:hypothetical protein
MKLPNSIIESLQNVLCHHYGEDAAAQAMRRLERCNAGAWLGGDDPGVARR